MKSFACFATFVVTAAVGSSQHASGSYPVRPDWQQVVAISRSKAKQHNLPTSGPTPGPTGFAVSPAQFGGDPLGQKDSTAAVRAAVAVCVNVSQVEPLDFPVGTRDAAGCTVDLQGGEYLISDTIQIPAFVGNMQMSRGSLRASSSFKSGAFMVVVGVEGACKFPQGSCNVDINFPDLFLDGSRVAHGLLQINSVMGTTVGPGTYMLNFTSAGIEVNGGHEVMILETWLGETNWNHHFTTDAPPVATAIAINSNDHYIQNSVVFSSLVGLDMRGAANYVSGLHVWFPWNAADQFGATAFQISGGQNRFSGCYIDCSKAVIAQGAGLVEFSDGFSLGGIGIVLDGASFEKLQIYDNEFQGGSGPGIVVPSGGQQNVTLVDSRFQNNLFNGKQGSATRVTKTVASTTPTTSWKASFCQEIVGKVQSVQFSVTADTGFPSVVARPVAADGCTVTLESQTAFTGSITVSVDSSTYSSNCGLC